MTSPDASRIGEDGRKPSATGSAVALLAFLLLCLMAGWIGSLATAPNIADWYAGLEKPPLTPPNGVFPVVWTILYVAMATAAWLVWREAGRQRWQRLVPFFFQLAVNVAWSFSFFDWRSPASGLAVIVLLLTSILWTMKAFLPASRVAATLLVPYLLWVAFASYLNLGILILNG